MGGIRTAPRRNEPLRSSGPYQTDRQSRPVKTDHFCSLPCELNREPCPLCLEQRRSDEERQKPEEGKPSLKFRPFAALSSRNL